MELEWKVVKAFPNYEISNWGVVRRITKTHGSSPAGTIMKAYQNPRGYVYVRLTHNGKSWSKGLHNIVAEAFLGEKPTFKNSRTEIDHIDCDKTNNRADNLQYVSAKINKRRAIRNGLHTMMWGKPIKINKNIADEIRKESRNGMRNCDIAKKFNVRASLVSDVICNRCWI